jgi:glycosyltransferase involved in cell wall biosynthesis
VIYNGVDLDFSTVSLGLQSHRRSGQSLVITVGRLVSAKDLDLFLEAAARLAHEQAEVRFWIVGDGPCRDQLERSASRNGLKGRVSFLGERADVPRLLQAADVFWLTSAWEGLPNVLLERPWHAGSPL